MTMVQVKEKTLNRRTAFRIYEQANIFYHKIDSQLLTQPQANFDNILNNVAASQTSTSLPASESRENDTLNVNISASGIAFSCNDELQVGDYLLLRILLLSSMTVIMTCCKVVHCKPGNPYETNVYPYVIGAHFVNLTADDTDLLNRHINNKKFQKRVLNGLLLSLAVFVLAMPDVAFGLLLSLGHHLLEIVLHLMHIAFELVESNLDHIIEHTFHTDTHDTQVIAFYIIVSFGFIGLYLIGRIIPRICLRFWQNVTAYCSRKKASYLYYWSEQTQVQKFKIIGLGIIAITCYSFFAI